MYIHIPNTATAYDPRIRTIRDRPARIVPRKIYIYTSTQHHINRRRATKKFQLVLQIFRPDVSTLTPYFTNIILLRKHENNSVGHFL